MTDYHLFGSKQDPMLCLMTNLMYESVKKWGNTISMKVKPNAIFEIHKQPYLIMNNDFK